MRNPLYGPSRRPAAPLRGWIAFGAVVSFAILFLSALPGAAPGPAGSAVNARLQTATGAASSFHCNNQSSRTPSAVLVPLANPFRNLVPNGTLTVTYEIEIANYTNSDFGMKIYVPTVWFKFPVVSGPTYSIHEYPQSFNITAAGWTNSSLTLKSVVVPAGLAFNQTSKASLTSEKLAVMATATYGNLTIELRWRWWSAPSANATTQGPWSVPSANSGWPTFLPTIFEPAPYAYLSNFNATAVIGSNYTVPLAGLVAGQTFFLEMEYEASGKVVQAHGSTAGPNATTFNATIMVLNYDRYLSPGLFLLHVHDSCGAMLWNKVLKAVYPPNASVTFYFAPGVCGPITMGGHAYTNNTTGIFAPSPTPYNFSLAVCKGHKFLNWASTGALHLPTSNKLIVSGSGTFKVEYS